MPQIDDPRYSRLLDVHKWSDHPEVKGLVDDLWEGCLRERFEGKRGGKARRGPKPKADHKTQLRVLILDLYVAWKEDPELCLGLSMSENDYKVGSRYNTLHISTTVIKLVKALAELGFIDLAKGSFAGPGAKTNRRTRIRASDALRALFEHAQFKADDVVRVEGEAIVLRDGDQEGDDGDDVEYDDTDATIRMRQQVNSYNDLISSTFIDIPTLQEPFIKLDPDRPGAVIRIGPDYCRTRRVFNRRDWEMNGRFYGGWWQGVDDFLRSQIFINNEPAVEVDFKGLHVAMLYARQGLPMEHDPYALQDGLLDTFSARQLRSMVKRLSLIAINAKSKSSMYPAFRDGFAAGDPAKKMTNKMLDTLLEAFVARNPPISDFLFSDQGIRLMYQDSRITCSILSYFTAIGVPVLAVHDSYIIDYRRVEELRDAMAMASRVETGFALETSIKLPDRPEYEHVSYQELREHVDDRKLHACIGYVDRMQAFDKRTGRNVCPPLWTEEELLEMYH